MGNNSNSPQNGLLVSKLVHLALPVRWSLWAEPRPGRGGVHLRHSSAGREACQFAGLNVGDLSCWSAAATRPPARSFGPPILPHASRAVHGTMRRRTTPWDDELRQIVKSNINR